MTPLYRQILVNNATGAKHVADGCKTQDKALKNQGDMNIFSAYTYVTCKDCRKFLVDETIKYTEENKQ